MWIWRKKRILVKSNHLLKRKLFSYSIISVILATSFCVLFTSISTAEDSLIVVTVPEGTIIEGESNDYEVVIPEGMIVDPSLSIRYEWDWNYNFGEFNTEDEYETTDRFNTMSHTYDDDGTYEIKVRIIFEQSEEFSSGTVTVTDSIPTVDIRITQDPPYYTKTEFTFDASGSLSASDEIIEYQWDWDFLPSDGLSSFENMESTDQNSMATHTYTEPGGYWAAVKVIDDDGSSAISYVQMEVEDTSGPIITNVYPPDGVLLEITTPTIQVTYDEDEYPIDQDSVLLFIDGMTVYPIISEMELMYTPYDEMTSGNHEITVEIPDTYGDRTSKKWTFSIVNDIIEERPGDIPEGEEITIIPDDSSDTSIVGLDIKPIKDLKNTTVTISRLQDRPIDIPDPVIEDDVVFEYLDIKLTADQLYVPEKDLESARIKFKVKKSWIRQYNIDKDSIRLLRYHNTKWEELPTELLNEHDAVVILVANTTGFSTFAVVGSQVVSISGPYETKTPEIPWITLIGITSIIMVILIVVLFKARYIYFREEHPLKDSKEKK